ncbi:MAG: glycosyltransferase family 9 protein [Bdellovibrionales bacterium]|nr:glycosyltransferase family 9 protein [Bdellovibrionales bacterium]
MDKQVQQKDNVLLVNITRLGDMLQSTPTLAGMKLENPNCKVSVVVEKQFEGICKLLPNIDKIYPVDLSYVVRNIDRGGDGIIDAYEYVDEFVEELKQENFDYCLNMSSSAYTALLIKLLGGVRSGGWVSDEQGYRLINSQWARLFATSVFHMNRQYNSLNLVDVFRCSAEVNKHPNQLLINVDSDATAYCQNFISEAKFTNQGPIIAVQAGASQGKRQWEVSYFVRTIRTLLDKYNARIILTGVDKELPIINPIKEGCKSENVVVAAGRTNLSQLAALLKLSDVFLTGDTGPMHVSVAVNTPVVSLFLASAFGFETGPYSEGNIVLQPVIACGPCNPNKSCARPDCHNTIEPEALAEIVMLRANEDIRHIPKELADPNRVIAYRSFFDEFTFCDLEPINNPYPNELDTYRRAYRKLWLDDLGGFVSKNASSQNISKGMLNIVSNQIPRLNLVSQKAKEGIVLIKRLIDLIKNTQSAPRLLGEVSEQLNVVDREIEEIGLEYSHLGPLTRMFVFSKENLLGTDPLELASQMWKVYDDLERRSEKLSIYYSN